MQSFCCRRPLNLLGKFYSWLNHVEYLWSLSCLPSTYLIILLGTEMSLTGWYFPGASLLHFLKMNVNIPLFSSHWGLLHGNLVDTYWVKANSMDLLILVGESKDNSCPCWALGLFDLEASFTSLSWAGQEGKGPLSTIYGLYSNPQELKNLPITWMFLTFWGLYIAVWGLVLFY